MKGKDVVSVVGLGYVGLPLAAEAAAAGFSVIGVDIDPDKVDRIRRRKPMASEMDDEQLLSALDSGAIEATCNFGVLSGAHTIVICVPTPLGKTKEPDVSDVIRVLNEVCRFLREGQLVVIESTTYPGFTREVALPILEKSGLRLGKEFFLAFSPERIDPGNRQHTLRNTPKIVAGVTVECTRRVREFYERIVDHVIPASSTDTAEMVKLFENTFRAVNIALANELSLMCNRLGVDAWEVIDAASSKPFGFMPFFPGPGLGGHCIPIDPLYLSWKMKTLNYSVRFIELAEAVNSSMPDFVCARLQDLLNEEGMCLRGTCVLVVGVSYKRNVSDVRETPAERIIETLRHKGADVIYHDPLVPRFVAGQWEMTSTDLREAVSQARAAVIVTDHDTIDFAWICQQVDVVLDTRGVTRRLGFRRVNVHTI